MDARWAHERQQRLRANVQFIGGFYYVKLTDQFQGILRGLNDSYGGETYYNFELTPCLHFTPDLQFFSPGLSRIDTTVVTWLRLMANF
ncbi:MAG: hypothetical protein ACHBNF_18540 [Chromatiales bacterium]